MAYRLLLPRFGMAMQKAKAIEWKKEVGDYIEKEEAVLIVENEKLTNEIISMEAGILLKKVAIIGEDYLVGDVLAWLGAEGEKIEDGAAEPAGVGPADATAIQEPVAEASEGINSGRVAVSPLARKLAAELGVDYTLIPGTGPGGRISKDDVLKYAESLKQQAVAEPAGTTSSATVSPAPALSATAVSAAARARQAFAAVAPEQNYNAQIYDAVVSGGYAAVPGRDAIVPYAGMRKAVGDKMKNAWSETPMVTHHVTADAGALLEIRRQLNEGVEDKNLKFSVNDLLLKLTAAALQKMPVMNATFENDGIHIHKNVNLGVATALENGLIVPVIHEAEKKSFTEISAEAKEIIAAAKAGELTSDSVSGGTFTVSNLGGYGSVDFFTPIINPPQVAILGVGRTADTVVPVGGEIRIRPIMGLSLTYDHRAIDGATAAAFMKIMIALLENPLRTLFL